MALDANSGNTGPGQWCQKLPVFFHDELVGLADVGEGAGVRNPQNQRVVEATRSLQNRAATGATSQDRYAVVPGLVEISFRADFI